MDDEARDQQRAAIAAAVTTGKGLTQMGSDLGGSARSGFNTAGIDFGKAADDYEKLIKRRSDLIKSALDAISKNITNFKPPPIPKIPGFTADAGETLASTSVDLPPTLGAFAADGLPDYSGATSQARAYAAATSSLFDLFDGSKRSLSFTATQERALNLNITFTGFTAALQAPIGLLERVADRMWETARFERETALINRETATLLSRGRATGSAFSDARNPPARKVTK